jgi:competence ComEA-like helix-hairpin-helix protein
MTGKSHFQLPLTLLTPWLLFASAAAGQDSPLPAGSGKQAVEKVCKGCHEMDTVIQVRRTMIGWQDMVQDMVSRGAEGSDDELSAVVQYLTQFFGKINVNTATAKELGTFLLLTDKETQAIVDYRETNGNFKDFEQLKTVPGVSAERLQAKKELIAFNR